MLALIIPLLPAKEAKILIGMVCLAVFCVLIGYILSRRPMPDKSLYDEESTLEKETGMSHEC